MTQKKSPTNQKTNDRLAEAPVPGEAHETEAEELAVEDCVYRPDIARKLAEIGAKLKDDALRSQADAVAAKQTDYVAEAVRLGAMLEAKWAAVCAKNHGGDRKSKKSSGHACPLDFTRLNKGISFNSQKETTDSSSPSSEEISSPAEAPSFTDFCNRVFGPGSERNMRRYRFLGRRWLLAATEPLHPQSNELAVEMHGDRALPDAAAVLLMNAGGEKGGLTLRHWIAGRSLRRLIADLRRADAEAQDEEDAEFRRLRTGTEIPPAPEDSGEPDAAPAPKDDAWRQLNLPGFVTAAKNEMQCAFRNLEEASGKAPSDELTRLWTDYRDALARTLRKAEAKLSILKNQK